ncbi:hypothetical protein OJ997_07045 [Solirubrobacter phytolaccae]|uniref:Uncharacterized protein n=1 Tax=Solirubrobacter phytolaccae TaxID=1404360 RepID=A0A9X3N5V4_9ACTN|nr:hypothetical protein [Solirubrobacter phytolaccae]MDA0180046.1 hypothetical protein [Solirubrobacter phytolaccae]
MRDPFDTFESGVREALTLRRRRRRRATWAIGGVFLALGGAATATAVVVRDEPSKPLRAPLPGTQFDYRAAMRPDLTAGKVGWCMTVVVHRGKTVSTGGNGCGPAASPDRGVVLGAGIGYGSRSLTALVVDGRAATVVVGNRRITPRPDRGVPDAWKLAVYTERESVQPQTTPTPAATGGPAETSTPTPNAAGGPAPSGAEPVSPVVLDAAGSAMASEDPKGSWAAGLARYPVDKVDPDDPPGKPCAIRAGALPHLRAVSANLLTRFPTTPPVVKEPAFLSCATTVFYIGKTRLRAAVLVDAIDHTRPAAPLPEHFQLSTRRVGTGWLVVFGGDAKLRKRLLAVLSTRLE